MRCLRVALSGADQALVGVRRAADNENTASCRASGHFHCGRQAAPIGKRRASIARGRRGGTLVYQCVSHIATDRRTPQHNPNLQYALSSDGQEQSEN
jgi:hypothetical protein